MPRIRWDGEDTYRGADQFANASMTVAPGDEIDVSFEKAYELVGVEGWSQLDGPTTAEVIEKPDSMPVIIPGPNPDVSGPKFAELDPQKKDKKK